jgi:hypothetical protein
MYCIIYHVSRVMYHVSCIMCHATIHYSLIKLYLFLQVELDLRGAILNMTNRDPPCPYVTSLCP